MAKNDSDNWKIWFARCSEPHWEALLRFGMSMAKSDERAQDLLQNTLLRGVRFFEKFARQNLEVCSPDQVELALKDPLKSKHFKNWLYKILRNVYLDEIASLKKYNIDPRADCLDDLEDPHSLSDDLMNAPSYGGNVWSQEGEQRFFKAAANDEMLDAINQLSERQRSVLYLVAEDHSYKEVADLLAIPIGTVMSTLSRGLQKLKNGLSARAGIKPQAEEVKRGEPSLGRNPPQPNAGNIKNYE